MIFNHHCDLDLEDSNPTALRLWLLMMHHYSKFDCNGLRIASDMEETVIVLRMSVRIVTLTFKIRIQPFRMTLRVMMMHHHTKFVCVQFSHPEDIFRAEV